MAFANEALLAALFEQWAQARDAGFGPVFESVQLAQVFRLAEQRAYLFEVLPHRCDDRIGAVQRVVRLYLRGAEVEACDLLGQSVDMRIGQLAVGRTSASSWDCGNSRIFSTYSKGLPSPPITGASGEPVTGNTSGRGQVPCAG